LQAGWVSPTVVFNNEATVTVKPYAKNAQVYKLPVGSTTSKEYFLVSNRHKQDFDNHLPGEGLVIEHVDDNVSNNTDENHYKVDIEQCDGNRDLNKNANRGDANDPFPTATNDKFTNTTTPNSKDYSGADSKISVTEIKRAGDNITAVINVGGVAAKKWYNKKLLRIYASSGSRNAWAYIQDVGWRRVKPDSADGVTNMFNMLVEARAADVPVTAYVDNTFIYVLYL
jgi:immune inhibitor A